VETLNQSVSRRAGPRQGALAHFLKAGRVSAPASLAIDRFGAPGTKKQPSLLYRISGDLREAVALAVTASEESPV